MRICERKEYFLRENVSGAENKECTFRFEADEAGLIFFFLVRDEDVISPFREDNEDIWQADAVEIFLSPDGDPVRYKEMEVSPYGIRFFCGHMQCGRKNAADLQNCPCVRSEGGADASGVSRAHSNFVCGAWRIGHKKDKIECISAGQKSGRAAAVVCVGADFLRKFSQSGVFYEFGGGT